MTSSHIARSIGAAILLFIIAGIAALITSKTAQGQPGNTPTRQVEVVNEASKPVPVAGTVSVSNLRAAPLPVRDVDVQARQPFHYSTYCAPLTGTSCLTAYTVPAGKRAVFEYVSANSYVGDSGAGLRLAVTTEIGGNRVTHALPAVAKIGGVAAVGERIMLYSDPGTSVVFSADRIGSFDAGNVFISISGFLTNAE